MAEQNGIGFLGRVPIDTALVRLLDAASKGEVEATGLTADVDGAAGDGSETAFPLLDRHLETTSSKVWQGIGERVVEKIGRRRSDIVAGSSQNGSA